MARIDIRQDIGPSMDEEYVSLFVADRQALEIAHQQAESAYPIFQFGHKTLSTIRDQLYDSQEENRSIDLGAMTYEVLAAHNYDYSDDDWSVEELLNPKRDAGLEVTTAYRAVIDYVSQSQDEGSAEYMLNRAGETMLFDAPKLTQVVSRVVGNHVKQDAELVQLALKGAAAMRAMHIGAIDYS